MRVTRDPDRDTALRVDFQRAEIPILRAALERASFMDIRPDLQERALDLLARLLAEVPPPDEPKARR